MKKVTKFITNDGKEFSKKEDAIQHENVTLGMARADKWLAKKGVELEVTDNAGMDNQKKILEAILSDLKGFTAAVKKKEKDAPTPASTTAQPNAAPKPRKPRTLKTVTAINDGKPAL